MTKLEYFSDVMQEQKFYDTSLRAWLLGYDSYYIAKFLWCLRWAEWHDGQNGMYSKIMCGWYKYRLRKLGRIYGFQIPLHTCGVGIKIYHHGTIIVNRKAKIGRGG